MVRLFFPVPEPAPAAVELSGARFHYLVHVLRLAPGDALEVFDGRGHGYQARLEQSSPERAVLTLGSATAIATPWPVTLLQGMPKGDKWEWILQKGTELGATAFVPVETSRSVVKLAGERSAAKQQRWAKIAEEAARQCGRADLPRVEAPQTLEAALDRLEAGGTLLVLDPEERKLRLGEAVASVKAQGAALVLAVGPEGGWSDSEREALSNRGGHRVSLGPRVLRAETAALAALAVAFQFLEVD